MKPLARRFFLVAGEHSGDLLGGKLMSALKARSPAPLLFAGVGGEHMAAEGLESAFPLADIAVMGPAAILARLPKLAARVSQATAAAQDFQPDCVVIIDSPEFTHRVARRIRRRRPSIPIVGYVSPSVWAWRPGRARRMAAYVDHLLALLPFEPEAHVRLNGPPCTYVGHPLIERLDWMASLDTAPLRQRLALDPARKVLVVLPGSRPTEVGRLLGPFGDAIRQLETRLGQLEVLLPAVASVRPLIEAGVAAWPRPPHLLTGEVDKFTAYRMADAALAASGTVTLELAVSRVPMVVAYRVDPIAARLRFLVRVRSIVLANLVLDRNVFPEFIQADCNGQTLADALEPLLGDTAARAGQLAGLDEIAGRMRLPAGAPSEKAAATVLDVMLAARLSPAARDAAQR